MTRRLQVVLVIIVPLLVAAEVGLAPSAIASIQDDGICWSPDVEFPTTCDEDDD